MRTASILSAILVTLFLAGWVFEREALLALGREGPVAAWRVLAGAGKDERTKASAAPRKGEAAATTPAPPPLGAATQPRPVPVIARHLVARPTADPVLSRGRTEALRTVEVRAETAGRVISRPLRKGAFVRAGDPLCELDPGTRRAALVEAEARLEEAKVQWRAATGLAQEGFAAETRVASARAALTAARAAVERARKEVERLVMRAPFDGYLENDTAELGLLLQPGSSCAIVLQLDPIKLVVFVPERDIARVRPGARATGRLASGGTVAGTVTFVARSADPATRTFRVEVEIPNPELAVRDGQTAEVLIVTERIRGHLLPASALTLDDSGRLGVRIVDADRRARFAPVRVLRDTPDGIWVTGLPEEVDVIVVGQEYVTDGVPVAPSFEELLQ